MATDILTDVFEEHRPTLAAVAYRMLGRVADAEDVVQDAWLRWTAQERDEVAEPRAYLVRITTRLAVDRLRQIQSRRESYIGPWLPEPVLTDLGDSGPGDLADHAVLAESISIAVLVVLESLSPLERAVFVLREAFGYPYGEIAPILDRSPAAVRQLAGRARRHVEERKPRYDVDPDECRDLTERFIAAATGGDLAELLSLLAPEARFVGDGGGKAQAPPRVLEGADKIARFLAAVSGNSRGLERRIVEVNGGLGFVALADGKPDSVVQLGIAEGRIHCVYVVRNPDKLSGVATV
ncbi:RNA polymerase sigma factor SigJ [Streptomyces sp. NPDC057638]|uniref:RNA polymerase sigma factor SigJ n=1 Tax=Streptomyces sp. NPDC057638 TaxID=3346190 RepID=UPI003677A666